MVIGLTVMVQLAVFPPSLVLAVMVAVPVFTAVTLPCESTVATEALLEDQETPLFVALLGETVAVSESFEPAVSVALARESPMPVTLTLLLPLVVKLWVPLS